MRKQALAPLALLLLACGCTTARLALPPELSDCVRYHRGWPVLESKQTHEVWLAAPPDRFPRQQHAAVLVAVHNGGSRPFNLSPSDVSVDFRDKPLHIHTHEELRSAAEREAAWMAFAAGLNAASAMSNASRPATVYHGGAYSGSAIATGPRGNAFATGSGTWTGSATVHDPAAAALAQSAIRAETADHLDRVAALRDNRVGSLGSILRTTTIDPGQTLAAEIRFAAPVAPGKPEPLRVTVRAAGEEHTFFLLYTRR